MSKRPRPASSGARKKPPRADKGTAKRSASGRGADSDDDDDAGVWSTSPELEAGEGSRGAKRVAPRRGSASSRGPAQPGGPGAGAGSTNPTGG
ncbi:MAG TPA: hypothetical protein VGO80_13950, partial [Solirubrobacteraceae bacterium]|nr:hypothetical protein [Solirubrobacteraceae bacterium]